MREEDVETPLDVYNSIRKLGFNVDYYRIPITDEQAPIPNVFNELIERSLHLSTSTDIIFNCQMGRGRTTTGIIITVLIDMIKGNSLLIEKPNKLL